MYREKKIRNLFIHGLWQLPRKGETGRSVDSEAIKLDLKKASNQDVTLLKYSYKQKKTYTKGEIERISFRVDSLIKRLKEIINLLEKDNSL